MGRNTSCIGRTLDSWKQQIQNVIDGTVDLTELDYRCWYKDALCNFGLKLRKGVTPYIKKPYTVLTNSYYGEPQYKTNEASYYAISQTRPIQGIEISKYVIWKLVTFGTKREYAVQHRNFTKNRVREYSFTTGFDRYSSDLSFKEFAPHLSDRKKSKDRHLKPGQDETLMLTIDFDCHAPSPQVRYSYVQNFKAFYQAVVPHPDIFNGLDYRVVFDCRKAYPGIHAHILFKPDRAVSPDLAYNLLINFFKKHKIDLNTEVYPNPNNENHLIRAPLSPSHIFIANKPYTKQKDKIDILRDIWWDWEPCDLMIWQDMEDYLINNCCFPVIQEDSPPPTLPQRRIEPKRAVSTPKPEKNATQSRLTPSFTQNFPIFKKGEWNPLIHKQYQRDPSELRTGDGRNTYMISMCGRILKTLQRKYNNNTPFEVFHDACWDANMKLYHHLPEFKELFPQIDRVFYKYKNYVSTPTATNNSKRERTSPSDLAIIDSNFQRDELYNKRRELILRSFSEVCAPCVEQSVPLHFIDLTEESSAIWKHALKFAEKHGMTDLFDGMSTKELHHMVSDLIRHHFQSSEFHVKGTRRTINEEKRTVYYGLKRIDRPHHVYNPKTKKAIFKHNNQVYRISADSPEHALEVFQHTAHNRAVEKAVLWKQRRNQGNHNPIHLVPTCPLITNIHWVRQIQDPLDWRMDVEDRLKRTYTRRFGVEMPKMLE